MKPILNPQDTAPNTGKHTMLQRIQFCRAWLYHHGFLTESDNARVKQRIERWIRSTSGR